MYYYCEMVVKRGREGGKVLYHNSPGIRHAWPVHNSSAYNVPSLLSLACPTHIPRHTEMSKL